MEDIFSGLLEGLAELLSEVAGGVLEGVFEWAPGGGESEGSAGPVERYKFLPTDSDG